LPRPADVALPTAGLLVGPKTAVFRGVEPLSRIAPRGPADRKPSVYNGFGDPNGSANASQNNSPLPQRQAAVAATFQPPVMQALSEIPRRADVTPSLNLGFDQSVGRMPLPDETRL
jgi:hypothetical protein